ncbi:MAG: hypothetical protein Unbinned6805contig1000_19 [Prokaryotic dsDNA virus sp.]|nr:MAG: hypothetical protein Unbinned6805contig1000_19 [Prokaryotic dsDNA virus sp.]
MIIKCVCKHELTEFYKTEKDVLIKRIKARGMQEVDAEDVVQEAFYRALKYFNTFNPDRQEIGAWFNTIMNNAFKDYRHANFTGDYSFREEDEEVGGEIEEDLFHKQLAKEIKDEISRMPIEERNILQAVFVLGHSYKACCQIFDLPYARVQFILQEFRKEMKEKYL